jgi:hypothetical protein
VSSALGAAVTAGALALLLLAGAALPAARTPEPPVAAGQALWGSLESLPERGTLVLAAPARAYAPDEAEAVRSFLAGGGRLLVVGPTPAAASLLQAVGLGIEARASRVFDPDVDAGGRFAVTGSGLLAGVGEARIPEAQVVVGGEPLASSGPFTWEDRNADGVPQVGEPRGSWPVAARATLGAGEAVVLGAPALLEHPEVRAALEPWMAQPVLADQGHRAPPEPLGMVALLSGEAALAAWGAVLLLAAGGLAAAWRVRVAKHRPRRRRAATRDWETLETLAELEA